MLNLLSYPDLRDKPTKARFQAACIAIQSDVNIRAAITTGDDHCVGLLPGWLSSIDIELRSPDSQFDKNELAIMHATISQLIDVLGRGASQTQDDEE